MNALIHGYFGMGNVGDEAILSALIEELRSRDIEPIVLSADPGRTARLHGVQSCREKILSLRFWRYFLKSSTLIFAGGGRYGKSTLRRMCILALLAKVMGKKAEFRAQGIYPYEWSGLPIITDTPKPFDSLTRLFIKLTFTIADKVTVRDEFSRQVLSLCGVLRNVEIEDDLAFTLKPIYEKSLHILSKHGVSLDHKPLIGVNLRTLHPKIRHKLVDVMSEFLNWLASSGAELVFVPFGYGSRPERFFDDDLIIAKELKKRMRNAERLKVIDNEYKPQEIMGFFRFFNLFVGMRFHSIIFSIMMEVPTIAMIYDTKTMELLKSKEVNRCIPVKIDELNIDVLKNATRILLSSKHE